MEQTQTRPLLSHQLPMARNSILKHQDINTLKILVVRDLKIRYVGSVLGIFWSVLNPLVLITMYTVIFSMIMKVKIGDTETPVSFGILVFSGMLPWLAIQDSMFRGSVCLTENARLIRRIPLPLHLFPLSCVLVALINQAFSLGVFLVILKLFFEVKTGFLFLIPALLAQTLLSLGIALTLSSTHTVVRDIAPMAAALSTVWFFATPIIYIYSMIPSALARFIYINPLTSLVGLWRAALLGMPLPNNTSLLFLAATSIFSAIAGAYLFKRLSPRLYDRL